MAEYIKREDAIRVVEKYFTDRLELNPDICLDGIRSLPDADVRPVVLCRDCEYCRKEDEFEHWCYGFCSPARLVRKDDFCSHGKAVLT